MALSIIIGIAVIVSIVTGLATYFGVKARSKSILRKAEAEGEMIKKEKLLQAKEKFIQLKSEHDRQVNERNQRAAQAEQRAKQIENNLQHQQRDLENKCRENDRLKEQLEAQLQIVEHKKEEISQKMKEQNARLEQISGMSSEEAKNILVGCIRSFTDASDDTEQAQKEIETIIRETASECSKNFPANGK